ncbi:MAG: hypothetical protein A2521_04515 [Deltaproteobacteria bacterium RIFOXYD12_FULL_57_12]|nr:MAG: hypothetical protein A2521_04515 [Deltaproteobacteria bacterium RIFOXYD12_FULL_57_12]
MADRTPQMPAQSLPSFSLALVAMPWSILNRPSIQLGALKAYLARAESWLTVDCHHPYLAVAHRLGPRLYHCISQETWISEALYGAILFPERHSELASLVAGKIRRLKRSRRPDGLDFDQVVAMLQDHLNEWLEQHDWHRYQLVGFSVCFNQLLASLAATIRLKQRFPYLTIVLGGSSCAAEMGASLLHFPQIEYVINGEGEIPLLELCEFMAGRRTGTPTAVITRANGLQEDESPSRTAHFPVRQLPKLQELPTPHYHDYFKELQRWFADEPFIPTLPVEFSRGCWWKKCAFCNLNLQWQGYRRKGKDQMLKEVLSLAEQHACLDFTFTDNVLPPQEAARFFSELSAQDIDCRFFGEIRATADHKLLTLYRRGGLTTTQVGIEALSNSLLKKINKGVSVIDNIAAMKAALEHGIKLEGNLITEFPGSGADEVEETLDNLDFVLPFPPLTVAAFFLGHGSLVAQHPDRFHIRSIHPHPNHAKIFPEQILDQLTLLIKDYRGDRQRQHKLWRPVVRKIEQWQEFHRQRHQDGCHEPALLFRDGRDFLIIRQELPKKPVLHHRLRGKSREIYLYCQEAKQIKELQERFQPIKEEQLRTFLHNLLKKRLMFSENDRYLALAIRRGN